MQRVLKQRQMQKRNSKIDYEIQHAFKNVNEIIQTQNGHATSIFNVQQVLTERIHQVNTQQINQCRSIMEAKAYCKTMLIYLLSILLFTCICFIAIAGICISDRDKQIKKYQQRINYCNMVNKINTSNYAEYRRSYDVAQSIQKKIFARTK